MDIYNKFHMNLQSVLEGENEAIQQAFDSYTDMILNNTEEFALGVFFFFTLYTKLSCENMAIGLNNKINNLLLNIQ